MSKTTQRRMVATLLLLDSLGIALALATAYWLRIGSGLLPYYSEQSFATYLQSSLLIIPLWLAIFAVNGLYDLRNMLGGLNEYTQVAKACLYGVVAVALLNYWVRLGLLSRGWLVLAWVLGVGFVGGARFLFRRVVYWLRRRGYLHTRVLIVGASPQGQAIARQFRAADSAGLDIVGFIDDFLPAGAQVILDGADPGRRREGTLRVLGGPDRLRDVVRDYQVSDVVVVSSAVAWETFQELLHDTSQGDAEPTFEIKLSPGFYEILTTGVQVTQEAFVPLLLVNRQRITGLDAMLKGTLDYGLALVSLVVALPLMALVAMGLRLGSPGPVLERYEVLARGGKTFVTWKFRTGLGNLPRLLPNHPLSRAAQTTNGSTTAMASAGAHEENWLQRFLYDTGLDKLPQIINVLRGDMSWVGPRTVSAGYAEAHSPWLPNLLTVKPGITGPWAVAQAGSLELEMRQTMVYIRNWTIWLDLQILAQTAIRMLRLERGKAQLPGR